MLETSRKAEAEDTTILHCNDWALHSFYPSKTNIRCLFVLISIRVSCFVHLLLRKPFKKKFLTNVQTIFYRLKERGDSIIILSLLCFRTRSATTCRCTASSWGCRTRERASPAGGWSTRTRPRLGSHPGEELQTLTMVSQLIITLWMKSQPLFRQTPSYCTPSPRDVIPRMILSFYCSFSRVCMWAEWPSPSHRLIVCFYLILMSARFLLQ